MELEVCETRIYMNYSIAAGEQSPAAFLVRCQCGSAILSPNVQ